MTEQTEVLAKEVKPDLTEIIRAIKIIGKTDLTEMRAYGGSVISGYYSDPTKLAADLYEVSEKQTQGAVCWTLQRIDPTKFTGEVPNKYYKAGRTTPDTAICEYSWLPFDCDPKRPSGVSATEAEKAAALEVATAVRTFLSEHAIPTVLADSSNGFHVLVPLKIPNSEGVSKLVGSVLQAMNALFENPTVKIDQTVFNPARILKAYGTVTRKGDNTPQRPHRLSRIINAPENTRSSALDRTGLEKLLDAINLLLPPEMQATLALGATEFEVASDEEVDFTVENVRGFLEWGGIGHNPRVETKRVNQGYLKVFYIDCPFDHGHTTTGSFVGSNESAQMIFHCSHDTCVSACIAAKKKGITQWQRFKHKVQELRADRFRFPLYNNGEDSEPWEGCVEGFKDALGRPYKLISAWDGVEFYTDRIERADGSATVTKRSKQTGETTVITVAAGGTFTTISTTSITTTGDLKFKKPKVNGGPEDYVLGPKKCEFGPGDFSQKSVTYEGWFPRSSISLIGGSSGVGKTSWTVPLLVKQAAREAYAGHEAYGLDYILFLRDRGGFALERLLRRLGLDEGVRENIVRVKGTGMQVIAQIVKAIESRGKVPGVVFIDGLDMTVTDPNKMPIVMEFLDWLGEISEHFHIAVIGAVGAPKRAKKDGGFTSQRDELYGSTAWGRAAETIVHAAEGDDGSRIFTVMHRNSPKEIFHMRFNAVGQLEECIPNAAEESAEPRETTWFRERKQLAADDSGKLYWSVTDLAASIHVSDSTALRRIKEALAKGWVQEKPGRQKGHAVQYRVTEMFK